MGTCAALVMKLETGKVTTSYVHYDGYPSHTLATLNNKYNSDEIVTELFHRGGMSQVDAKGIDYCNFYDNVDIDAGIILDETHSIESYIKGEKSQYGYVYFYEVGKSKSWKHK
jgi:hypothetical protein